MTGNAIPDPEAEPVISVEEAGQILGLKRSAAFDACRRGEIPSIRVGRRLLVPVARLRRLVGLSDDDPGPRAA